MCGHSWVKMNDISVCKKCGLTLLPNGKVMFDRKFPDYLKRKKVKRKNERTK